MYVYFYTQGELWKTNIIIVTSKYNSEFHTSRYTQSSGQKLNYTSEHSSFVCIFKEFPKEVAVKVASVRSDERNREDKEHVLREKERESEEERERKREKEKERKREREKERERGGEISLESREQGNTHVIRCHLMYLNQVPSCIVFLGSFSFSERGKRISVRNPFD